MEVTRSGTLSNMSVTERMKKIAGMWKDVSPAEKEGWKNKHQTAMQAYKVELEQWQKANPDKVAAIQEAKAKKSAAVAATKPPKPAPAKKAAAKKAPAKKAPAKKAVKAKVAVKSKA